MSIESFLQDARFGSRTLLKARGFAVACVLTLALGIGCATTMFSLFEGPILNRPPVHDLERIANIWMVNHKTGDNRGLVSGADFLALRNSATVFEELTALAGADEVLTGKGQPRHVAALMVASNFFHLLGVNPKLGRAFSKNDEQPGAPPVAVISDAIWHSDFGGRVDALGQDIRLNGVPYRVVGVMPTDFWFGDQGTEVWMPLTNPADRTLVVVGRLKKSITDKQANADIAVLAHALELQFPSANQGMGMRVVTYESEKSKKAGLGLVFGMGPSILVLLIGCANITNLLLARGFVRQTEFATRAALGATRSRIVRQLLSEYSIIAITGVIAGVLAAYGGVVIMRRAFQSVEPRLAATLHLNGSALLFGTVAGLLLPLGFALIAAARLSKTSLNDALRQASATANARVSLKRLPLVVLEVTMAMTLLIVTASATRTMAFIERVAPPKIDTDKVVAFSITPTEYGSGLNRLGANLQTLPGIEAVGITSGFPTSDPRGYLRPLSVRQGGANTEVSAVELTVDRGFFSALRLSTLEGELVSSRQSEGVVVSESLARRYGPDALRLQVRSSDGRWMPVTAVVSDWLTDARSGQPVPTIYFPLSKLGAASQIVVRAEDAPAVIPGLIRAVRNWNPDEPMDDCKTVAQAVRDGFAGSNLVVQLMASFTILALVLACVGVYGMMNYSVTRRTHEMGIRMALGASPNQVLGLVLKEAALLLVVGLSTGWLFGIGAGRLIAHELVIAPSDPAIAIVCSAMILITGLTASYIPARRAAHVNPIIALRFE